MNTIGVATDFAKWAYTKRNTHGIEDIILYGSVAKHGCGKDVDIMLVHQNPALVVMERLNYNNKEYTVPERFVLLNQVLSQHKYLPIADVTCIDSCRDALACGVLHAKFVHRLVFEDNAHYENELNFNIDKNFFNNVLSYALVWNSQTEKFDIPMNVCYSLPK